ncbi:hypothetical protein GCM10009862_16040 [Microbacterium binotii]|uniref:HNH endonuclease n=1 Tax=Microbacterium binotii TaxID=462710 RepID=A0ABN3PBJ8_9MICO
MPQWKGSTRKSTLPADWDTTVRPRILRRDGYRCVWIRADTNSQCGDRANQVDHIDQARRWDHSDGNLQSLCEYHHQRKSSAEGGRGNRRKQPARRHPGLLA